MRAAAAGALQAQRVLADRALTSLADGETSPFVAISEGLVFARLAATHGDLTDHGRLLLMLSLAADVSPNEADRDELDAEALARLAVLADEGIDAAADQLPILGEIASSGAAARALDVRELMAADQPLRLLLPDGLPAIPSTLDRVRP